MASTNEQQQQPQACCAKCKKTGGTLTSCERCDVVYCSRSCQVAHWKAHKKTCARDRDNRPSSSSATGPETTSSAGGAGAASGTSGLVMDMPMPFTRLEKGIYLHDRPEADTYQLLIDTHRLRLEDTSKFEGVQEPGSIYAAIGNDPLPGFRRFLDTAKAKAGILPPWWNEDKQKECEELGMRAGWASLRKKVQKSEIISHYGDAKFPMQLRMLGEAIYGRGPGGVDGSAMRQMMVLQEAGSLRGHTAHLDIS
ncbi:hypothetical protein MGN70_005770 [Eutypa lata]|nr:hypothetical protein MGN70_005770 [Eutypa lata]